MIKANIEAAIEAKTKEREKIYNDLNRIDSLIEKLKAKKSRLLDQDTELYYEIEELKEGLNNEL